jgi:indolepyruvate ferredoxin oxidoreductase alpha subunit
MGNEAIAHGALRAGVSFACGYAGTPSTEVLETLARIRPDDLRVEWSVNEKAALETAAGASYAGLRTLVTMKQVGLNVASDPLMSLAYIGVLGGMVVLVADDPGPISSQTEQDTRTVARYSKLPCFDPASPEEAFEMIQDAFALSEKYRTPVLFRPTTRLCHATASIATDDVREKPPHEIKFIKSPNWVIFPRLSVQAHANIEKRNPMLSEEFSAYRFNSIEDSRPHSDLGRAAKQPRGGIAVSGVNYAYVKEALAILNADCKILKIATPFPFPYTLAEKFLKEVDVVLTIEELDPVIERELVYLTGRNNLKKPILGKETGNLPPSGENSVDALIPILAAYLSVPVPPNVSSPAAAPPLPQRPPVLCAGCPHRASFYAVKKALRGKKAVFAGDIGCYTLGNAQPLDMVDTCLCMGAGITVAQGLKTAEPDTTAVAFVGDSTFFASGMTGAANAVFNRHDMLLVVLDNRVTAMTGGQTHPGIGKTLMGEETTRLSIPEILRALGVSVRVANPLAHDAAVAAVRDAAGESGVRAVVFESPCVNLGRPSALAAVNRETCVACGSCVREIGCPALHLDAGGKPELDVSLCTGCALCAQICPAAAITTEVRA